MPRPNLKSIGLIFSGFVVGAVSSGGIVALRCTNVFKKQYYARIAEVADAASQTREGDREGLLKNAEATLREGVTTADSLWKDDARRLQAFWSVQRYYTKHNLRIPAEIKPILDRLPPPPADETPSPKAQTTQPTAPK